jgi:alkaline phosphatase
MQRRHKLALRLTATTLLLGVSGAVYAHRDQLSDSPWTEQGREAIADIEDSNARVRTRAKNVILFVGDGMGVSTVTAARILEGQLRGEPGEENALSFERFPSLALVKTYSVNQQTSDSAPTMTAIVTGVKTKDGVLSIDEDVIRGDHTTVAGNELKTILELAEGAGLSTGVVSTARLTHATPAACYAHSPERDWESDAELPAAALAAGFKDIARQLVEHPVGNGLEVALGGGRSYFIPNTTPDPEDAGTFGRRRDGRDLTETWASAAGSAYVWNKAQFDAIAASSTDRLLGLFERSHMEYEADRAADAGGEPSIAELTLKAIEILSKNERGFFLMVEGGRIDHAHHAGNAHRALTDTIAFSDAVRVAQDRTSAKDTLILATADHSHVFTIAGYPTRGNDILGKVISNDNRGFPESDYSLDANGLPYTTVSYANGPGYRQGARPDLTDVDTTAVNFLQEAAVPLSSETHAGEDVALYATGPSSQLVRGSQEQTLSFYVMARALGLDGSRRQSWWRD